MAIRDLRINFFPSRTFWTIAIVIGIVVGLFFIPEIINLKKSGTKSTRKVESAKAKIEKDVSDTRGSIRSKEGSTGASEESTSATDLKDVEAAAGQPLAEKNTEKKEVVHADLDDKEGFFSGLGKKIKARGGGGAEPPKGPVNIAELNLTSKEAQALFKKGRSEVFRFYESLDVKDPAVRSTMYDFIGNLQMIGNGLPKTVDNRDMQRHLIFQAERVTAAMIRGKVDRGMLMKWYEIQIVQILQNDQTQSLRAEIASRFRPVIQLQSINVRQKPLRPGYPIEATLKADVGVRGQDIERIEIFAGSTKQREVRMGRPKPGGFTNVKLSGNAIVPWTLVAYDKYGSRVFRKAYSFLPRMRRFPLAADGTYVVGFRGGTSPAKLDKYFTSAVSRETPLDPSISVF